MDIKEYNVNTVAEKKNHPWESARLVVVKDLLKNYLDKTNTGKGIVVDIGCGDAFFVSQLAKEFGNINFYAVDTAFTSDIISLFETRYSGINIKFCQTIDDIQHNTTQHNTTQHNTTQHNTIDVILLLDVIEHIENDVEFLKSLNSIPGFSNETLVCITVPAFQSLFVSRDKWLGHYRRYTKKMLLEHINQAGFMPVKTGSGYFFTSLLLPRFLVKIKEKFFKSNNNSGIGDYNGGSISSFLYKTALILDYRFSKLFNHRLAGLSCYTICKQRLV